MASRVNQLTRTVKQKIVYADFQLNFALNPQTQELAMLYNEQSVIQAITNLVMIYNGEIYYHPEIGSTVSRSLFEFADQFSANRLKDSVLLTIRTFEPRAQNLQCQVTGDPVNNQFNVDIKFTLVNIPGQVVNVPTIVIRVR